MLMTLLAVLATLGVADFSYDRVVHFRNDRWEKTIKRDATGLREGYEPFEMGKGDTALLMIHGFGAGPLTFGRMAPVLAARGYTCHALLLPGFGMPNATYSKATAARWRAAIRSEVAMLRMTHKQVWLVGHSMGGTLATVEALDHPGDIDGLVLLAPLIEVSSKRSPIFTARTWFRIADHAAIFTDLTEMAFPVDVHDPVVRTNVVRDQFVPRSIYRQMFSLTDAARGRAGELTLPVFLAYAPQDKVADADAAVNYVGKAKSSRKVIFCSQDSGHVITWDLGWEKCVDAIDRFISGKNQGG